MINIESLNFKIKGHSILKQINVQWETEKTHVLIGSSGCGKSTLIRLILGLLPIQSGTIHLGDLVVQQKKQNIIAKKVGYVIQDGGLFPHLSARKNVELVLKIHEITGKEQKNRIEKLLHDLNLNPRIMDLYPRQLSGGQKQRVALMRALAHDPEYLFFDEPLSALDPMIRSELQKHLKSIFEKLKKTVVLVTHDMGEAAYFAHTITLMNQGKIIQHSPYDEFFKNPQDPFVSEFINAQRQPPELTL
ncbi:MAG: ABC transporter ATP-binding protein [Bdellovibrionaceae bacterium]|nr:ABC transporter ATP-binding protein [Pseudobdellovibrionaceae bacterium]